MAFDAYIHCKLSSRSSTISPLSLAPAACITPLSGLEERSAFVSRASAPSQAITEAAARGDLELCHKTLPIAHYTTAA